MARYVMVEASKDPRDRGHGPGAWTTEWSAAMDERRGEQPGAESGPAVPRQIRAGLSPLQQTYARFTDHFMGCEHCRDVDRGRCDTGDRLWRAYQAEDDLVRRQMASEAP